MAITMLDGSGAAWQHKTTKKTSEKLGTFQSHSIICPFFFTKKRSERGEGYGTMPLPEISYCLIALKLSFANDLVIA